MGIDRGEIRPGIFGILIANFADEPSTLARLDNPRRLLFSDVATSEGVAGPSRWLLKFGCFFFDYDLDGRQDMLTCNGHLEPEIAKVQPGQSYPQSVQLFWNTGGQRADGTACRGFEPVTAEQAGTDLFQPLVGRGCAYGCFGDSGAPDVVLVENGGPARLLRNECSNGHHWVRLELKGDGKRSNSSAIGARITLKAGNLVQQREICSARGYLSQSELPVAFGLGSLDKIERVIIRWPGKEAGEETWTDLAVDRTHILRQGQGTASQ
jgi:hypothetical protein